MSYPKLFTPGRIGNLELKNRIVMAPLAMGVADPDQTIGRDFLAYLLERAKGGVGLIILENTRVDDKHGVAAKCQASVARDEHIAPLKAAVEALHKEGTKVFTQLHHPGRETFMNLNGNEPLWGAGPMQCGVCQQEVRGMTTEEIEDVIQLFIDGAVRSQKAGCDGVELHAAHGYLLSQFLSPYTNHRADRFGGSFENRLQMIKEIILGIQAACGTDFPISVRLTVDELLAPNGVSEYLRLEDGIRVSQELEKLGIAVINVSNGIYESFNSLSEPMTYDQGCRSDRIRAIKNNVHIPVIAVNMIKEPWFAEKMLEDDLVDFVALGRAVVADPEWAKKAEEGREDEINRCISCTFCFETLVSDTIGGIGPVKCAVNPRAARELKYPAYKKDGLGRRVIVIGGGVSGLEAARVLAERGFQPIVLEKSGSVGGQINIADKPPRKHKINWIVEYELKKLSIKNVEIRVNVDVTPKYLNSLNPYAIVIATGAEPICPKSIKGLDLPNACTVNEALSGKTSLYGKNVAVIGSGATGLEAAEFLCERDNHVTVVEMLDSIGKGVYVQHYLDAMDRLSKYDVTYLPSHQLCEVKKDCIILKDLSTGEEKSYPAEAAVLSLGVKSVCTLSEECKKFCRRVLVVGDAEKPGRVESAVRSAFEAAYSL